jgi:hypothetical protein
VALATTVRVRVFTQLPVELYAAHKEFVRPCDTRSFQNGLLGPWLSAYARTRCGGLTMKNDTEEAEVFRQRAAELRAIAKGSADLTARQELWDLANSYERRAKEREGQQT